MNRLNPPNPGNAKLLYIDGDLLECDICDEKKEAAVFMTIGGRVHLRQPQFIYATLKRFE